MKVGIFLNEVDDSIKSQEEKFRTVGMNTGNLLYWDALKHILNLQVISSNMSFDVDDYYAFVTTELVWMRPNIDYWWVKDTLKKIGDRPLVPISIGLQASKGESNFTFHPNTLELLRELQERCVLGVRGYYSAEVLNNNGIHNIKVIGCPSMYKNMDTSFKILKKYDEVTKICLNFRTFYDPLEIKEKEFLLYGAKYDYGFVEQTLHNIESSISKGIDYEILKKWLERKGRLFFDNSQWKHYISKFDFSMGARFHGNVMALWSHIPALFITVDSRTDELCEFYSLPSIEFSKFDKTKPIQYYYDLADYTSFNKVYVDKINNFKDYLQLNNLLYDKK